MMLFSSGDLVASEVLQFAQLQGFCLLLYFVSIDPIPRPPQYFGPVRLSHPAECNQSSPKSKCPLNHSGGVTDSCAEPFYVGVICWNLFVLIVLAVRADTKTLKSGRGG